MGRDIFHGLYPEQRFGIGERDRVGVHFEHECEERRDKVKTAEGVMDIFAQIRADGLGPQGNLTPSGSSSNAGLN